MIGSYITKALLMTLTTYTVTAPFRTRMEFKVEAEKGLSHQEICNLVENEHLKEASIMEDEKERIWSWEAVVEEKYHFAYGDFWVHPNEMTVIEDMEGNNVVREEGV